MYFMCYAIEMNNINFSVEKSCTKSFQCIRRFNKWRFMLDFWKLRDYWTKGVAIFFLPRSKIRETSNENDSRKKVKEKIATGFRPTRSRCPYHRVASPWNPIYQFSRYLKPRYSIAGAHERKWLVYDDDNRGQHLSRPSQSAISGLACRFHRLKTIPICHSEPGPKIRRSIEQELSSKPVRLGISVISFRIRFNARTMGV